MDIGIRADGLPTETFEDFAIEIFKQKFGLENIHGFKSGKDNGIDAIDDIKAPTLIMQAKRWKINKRASEAVSLLKKEIDKIYQSKIDYDWKTDFKYVIITSMGLSPSDLKSIRDYAELKLPGVMPSDDYIIYSSTLKTLSQDKKYRNIFMNYGLLEKDISKVLRDINLRGIELESRDYFSDIDVKYFVETSFLGEAYHILQREHIILIQGPAGIGKTTTCSMLGNLFLNNKENYFDVIVRKVEDIKEVIRLYNDNYRSNNDKSLFVVFDDFLGRNRLEVDGRVLQDIRTLYSASTNSKNLYICLNSRTQILQDARILNFEFQKLIDEKIREERNFVIDLSRYTDNDRAHIFRKTFERKLQYLDNKDQIELDLKYRDLIGKKWMQIIKHRNYFPRSIELIANNFKESTGNFYDYVIYHLSHPNQLYNNLFDNLKSEEKYLLFSLSQFDNFPIKEEWLKNSFYSLKLDPTFDLEKSLKKLDGSWLTFIMETLGSKKKIDFLNPSILDFLYDKVEKLPDMKKYILQNAVYVKQLLKNCRGFLNLEGDNNQVKFLHRLLENWDNFIDCTEFLGEKMVAIIYFNRYQDHKKEFRELLSSYNGIWNLHTLKNGWSEVISQINRSGEIELKKLFLESLEDKIVVNRILESHNLESSTLDYIVYSIDSIIQQIYYSSESEFYANNVKEMKFFSLFRNKKIEIIQSVLDDFSTVQELDVDITEPDIDYIIVSQTYDFMREVEKMLSDDFDWQEELNPDSFNYDQFQSNLSEYIDQLIDESSYDYDSWRDLQLEERYEIENILNKPLL